jgi:hypothetical protein
MKKRITFFKPDLIFSSRKQKEKQMNKKSRKSISNKKNSENVGKRKMNKIQFVKNVEVAMIDFKIQNKTLKN